jgi:hypothetical protein
MYHFDGSTYTPYTTTVSGLRAVAGSGGEIWAVGNAGGVLQWNGVNWAQIDAGTRHDLYSVFLVPTKQWLAGDLGTLLSRPR